MGRINSSIPGHISCWQVGGIPLVLARGGSQGVGASVHTWMLLWVAEGQGTCVVVTRLPEGHLMEQSW